MFLEHLLRPAMHSRSVKSTFDLEITLNQVSKGMALIQLIAAFSSFAVELFSHLGVFHRGCWREWPNRSQFLGAVLAAQSVPKPQIPGFSGHFPAGAGK